MLLFQLCMRGCIVDNIEMLSFCCGLEPNVSFVYTGIWSRASTYRFSIFLLCHFKTRKFILGRQHIGQNNDIMHKIHINWIACDFKWCIIFKLFFIVKTVPTFAFIVFLVFSVIVCLSPSLPYFHSFSSTTLHLVNIYIYTMYNVQCMLFGYTTKLMDGYETTAKIFNNIYWFSFFRFDSIKFLSIKKLEGHWFEIVLLWLVILFKLLLHRFM